MTQITAKYKQATSKDGGVAVLQFEVDATQPTFTEVFQMVGQRVALAIEPHQKTLDLDEYAGRDYEDAPCEIEMVDMSRALPEMTCYGRE